MSTRLAPAIAAVLFSIANTASSLADDLNLDDDLMYQTIESVFSASLEQQLFVRCQPTRHLVRKYRLNQHVGGSAVSDKRRAQRWGYQYCSRVRLPTLIGRSRLSQIVGV